MLFLVEGAATSCKEPGMVEIFRRQRDKIFIKEPDNNQQNRADKTAAPFHSSLFLSVLKTAELI